MDRRGAHWVHFVSLSLCNQYVLRVRSQGFRYFTVAPESKVYVQSVPGREQLSPAWDVRTSLAASDLTNSGFHWSLFMPFGFSRPHGGSPKRRNRATEEQ